jgi:hypothetical protein
MHQSGRHQLRRVKLSDLEPFLRSISFSIYSSSSMSLCGPPKIASHVPIVPPLAFKILLFHEQDR